MNAETVRFLRVKIATLVARARRRVTLDYASVGIRQKDAPYAPSQAHFMAARGRLNNIDQGIQKRVKTLTEKWPKGRHGEILILIALVEREIDRARRTFDLFFDLFSQRGTSFAPTLAAHDIIAGDCYRAVQTSAPQVFRGPLLKPLSYLDQGFSPATNRRGVQLNRLLGERNPFPIIRIPWDRDNPWQAAFLHEVAHNLQADLGIWLENKRAVGRRVLRASGNLGVTRIFSRWHKEIWADLAALLLGGPASAWGLMDFLAHPAPKVMTFKPGGVHPTGFIRVLIATEMLRRMGFEEEAFKMRKVWTTLFRPQKGHRIPVLLLASAEQIIPHVVDEIAFQTKRNLAQRAVADMIQFTKEDQREIQKGARLLTRGTVPNDLPPRFLVSASRYALQLGGISPKTLSQIVIGQLTKFPGRRPKGTVEKQKMIAA